MLVLKRKLGEKVAIGKDVVIEVVEISGNYVRLGFTAPAEVSVDRMEVRLRKEADKCRKSRNRS